MEWKGLWTYVENLIPGKARPNVGLLEEEEEEFLDVPEEEEEEEPGRIGAWTRRRLERTLQEVGGAEGSCPPGLVTEATRPDSDDDVLNDEEVVLEEERALGEEDDDAFSISRSCSDLEPSDEVDTEIENNVASESSEEGGAQGRGWRSGARDAGGGDWVITAGAVLTPAVEQTDATDDTEETDVTGSEEQTDTTDGVEETDVTGSEEQTDTTDGVEETDVTGSEEQTDTTGGAEETDVTVSEEQTDTTGGTGEETDVTADEEQTDTTGGTGEETDVTCSGEQTDTSGGTREETDVTADEEQTDTTGGTGEETDVTADEEQTDTTGGTGEETDVTADEEQTDTTGGTGEETDVTADEEQTDTTGGTEEETDVTVSEEQTDTTGGTEEETDVTVSEEQTDTTGGTGEETDVTVSEEQTDTKGDTEETDATGGAGEDTENRTAGSEGTPTDVTDCAAADETDTGCSVGEEETDTRGSVGEEETDTSCSVGEEETDTRGSVGEEETDTSCSVGEEETDTRGSVGEEETDTRGSVGEEETDTSCSVGEEETDTRGSVGEEETDTRGSVGEEETDARGSVGEEETNTRGSVGEEETDTSCSVGEEETDTRGSVGKEEMDTRGSVGEEETDTRCSVGEEETDTRCSVGEEETDTSCSVGEEETDTSCSVGEEETDTRGSVGEEETDTRGSVGEEETDTRGSVGEEETDTRGSIGEEETDTRGSVGEEETDTRGSEGTDSTTSGEERTDAMDGEGEGTDSTSGSEGTDSTYSERTDTTRSGRTDSNTRSERTDSTTRSERTDSTTRSERTDSTTSDGEGTDTSDSVGEEGIDVGGVGGGRSVAEALGEQEPSGEGVSEGTDRGIAAAAAAAAEVCEPTDGSLNAREPEIKRGEPTDGSLDAREPGVITEEPPGPEEEGGVEGLSGVRQPHFRLVWRLPPLANKRHLEEGGRREVRSENEGNATAKDSRDGVGEVVSTVHEEVMSTEHEEVRDDRGPTTVSEESDEAGGRAGEEGIVRGAEENGQEVMESKKISVEEIGEKTRVKEVLGDGAEEVKEWKKDRSEDEDLAGNQTEIEEYDVRERDLWEMSSEKTDEINVQREGRPRPGYFGSRRVFLQRAEAPAGEEGVSVEGVGWCSRDIEAASRRNLELMMKAAVDREVGQPQEQERVNQEARGPSPALQEVRGPSPALQEVRGLPPPLQEARGLPPPLQEVRDLPPALQEARGLASALQEARGLLPALQEARGLPPALQEASAEDGQPGGGASGGSTGDKEENIDNKDNENREHPGVGERLDGVARLTDADTGLLPVRRYERGAHGARDKDDDGRGQSDVRRSREDPLDEGKSYLERPSRSSGSASEGRATRPKNQTMVAQFSDVAKQIMKEVQDSRSRKNKCLRDLRSLKPRTRFSMSRKHKDKSSPVGGVRTVFSRDQDEDLGRKVCPPPEPTLEVRSQVTEISLPSTKSRIPVAENYSLPPAGEFDVGASISSSIEFYEALRQLEPVHTSPKFSGSPARRLRSTMEGSEDTRMMTEDVPEPLPPTVTASQPWLADTGVSYPRQTLEGDAIATGTKESKGELSWKGRTSVSDIFEVTPTCETVHVDRKAADGAASPVVRQVHEEPPGRGSITPSTAVAGEAQKPDSRDPKRVGEGGGRRQCSGGTGRVRVLSSTAARLPPLPDQSKQTPDGLQERAGDEGDTVRESVDENDSIEGEEEVGNGDTTCVRYSATSVPLEEEVVKDINTATRETSPVEEQTTCSTVPSTVCRASLVILAPEAVHDSVPAADDTSRGKTQSSPGTSPITPNGVDSALEILDNAANENRENRNKPLSWNESRNGSQGIDNRETNVTVITRCSGESKKSVSNSSSEDGEVEPLEGPWSPQLARVVQELVVSKKFNMTSAQAKKRQHNISRLDVQQKDRTLIFDSSKLSKTKSEGLSQLGAQEEALRGTARGIPKSGRRGGRIADQAGPGKLSRKRKETNGQEHVHGSNPSMSSDKRTHSGEDSPPTDTEVPLDNGDPAPQSQRPYTKHNSDRGSKGESKRGGGPREKYLKSVSDSRRTEAVRGPGEGRLRPAPRVERPCRSPQPQRGRPVAGLAREVSPRQSPVIPRRQGSPRGSPQLGSPRLGSPRSVSPKIATKRLSPKSGSPKLGGSPKTSPASRSPKLGSPRIVKPIVPQGLRSPRLSPALDQRHASPDHQDMTEMASRSSLSAAGEVDDVGMTPGAADVKIVVNGHSPEPIRKGNETVTPSEEATFWCGAEMDFRESKMDYLTVEEVVWTEDVVGPCGERGKTPSPDGEDLGKVTEGTTPASKAEEPVKDLQRQTSDTVASKNSGKLDSEIIQFFESQQQRPREICRNEKVIPEHFRGNSKGGSRKSSLLLYPEKTVSARNKNGTLETMDTENLTEVKEFSKAMDITFKEDLRDDAGGEGEEVVEGGKDDSVKSEFENVPQDTTFVDIIGDLSVAGEEIPGRKEKAGWSEDLAGAEPSVATRGGGGEEVVSAATVVASHDHTSDLEGPSGPAGAVGATPEDGNWRSSGVTDPKKGGEERCDVTGHDTRDWKTKHEENIAGGGGGVTAEVRVAERDWEELKLSSENLNSSTDRRDEMIARFKQDDGMMIEKIRSLKGSSRYERHVDVATARLDDLTREKICASLRAGTPPGDSHQDDSNGDLERDGNQPDVQEVSLSTEVGKEEDAILGQKCVTEDDGKVDDDSVVECRGNVTDGKLATGRVAVVEDATSSPRPGMGTALASGSRETDKQSDPLGEVTSWSSSECASEAGVRLDPPTDLTVSRAELLLTHPSTDPDLTHPNTSQALKHPSTEPGLADPSTDHILADPSTGRGPTDPSTDRGLTDPSTDRGLTDPSTDRGLTDFGTDQALTDPCTDSELKAPCTQLTEVVVGEREAALPADGDEAAPEGNASLQTTPLEPTVATDETGRESGGELTQGDPSRSVTAKEASEMKEKKYAKESLTMQLTLVKNNSEVREQGSVSVKAVRRSLIIGSQAGSTETLTGEEAAEGASGKEEDSRKVPGEDVSGAEAEDGDGGEADGKRSVSSESSLDGDDLSGRSDPGLPGQTGSSAPCVADGGSEVCEKQEERSAGGGLRSAADGNGEVFAPDGSGQVEVCGAGGGTAAARRWMSGHRRLTKTISEGNFTQAEGPDSQEQLAKLSPPPTSLQRSRTQSEFLPETLEAAATNMSRSWTVSEIFARGVYGRLRMKSRSVENIRVPSLSTVEITSAIDTPPPPRTTVSSCRIVGVLKKKDSVSGLAFLSSSQSQLGQGGSSDARDLRKDPSHISGTDRKTDVQKDDIVAVKSPEQGSSEAAAVTTGQAESGTKQPAQPLQPNQEASRPRPAAGGKSSAAEAPVLETHIYENVPQALYRRSLGDGTGGPQVAGAEEDLALSAAELRKLVPKVVHIYENLQAAAAAGTTLDPALTTGRVKEPQQIQEDAAAKDTAPGKCVPGGEEPGEVRGSPRAVGQATQPAAEVPAPRRATYEKSSIRRRQQPESESRTEKQKSNYMKQKTVRVGILKKQKSDITGVRLQKLHYFDNELPGERRRSYSISGGVSKKSPLPQRSSSEAEKGVERQTSQSSEPAAKVELSEVHRRCHSSISAGSSISRSSAIDRILQSCAPCISSNTTSTLDLSVAASGHPNGSRADPTQRGRDADDAVFSDSVPYTGRGSLPRRHQPRAWHPYKTSYSTSDVTAVLRSESSSLVARNPPLDGQSALKDSSKDITVKSGLTESEGPTKEAEQEPERPQASVSEQSSSSLVSSPVADGATTGTLSDTYFTGDEATLSSGQETAENSYVSFERESSATPTPEQGGKANDDTDFYSELLDTILSVVDAQEPSISPEADVPSPSVALELKDPPQFTSETTVQESPQKESGEEPVEAEEPASPGQVCLQHPATTSDSDSTSSVDSELAEVRRRVSERFPPAPRADPEASQESVMASPSAVCPMPTCAACRSHSINFSQPLVFTFDEPVTSPMAVGEPARAASLPYVDLTHDRAVHDLLSRSASLPHEVEVYHSTQAVCRTGDDEYWSAGEEAGRGAPQVADPQRPRRGSSPQHTSPRDLSLQDSSPKDSSSQETSPKDSTSQDSSPKDSSSQDSSPKDSSSQGSSSKDSSSQDSSPKDSLPQDRTSQEDPQTDSGLEGCRDHSESSSNQLVEELSQLRLENEKLSARNRSLQSEVEELRRVKEAIAEEDLQLKPRINEMTIELTHAKEALSALKADRKRLKAEKFDLLNQMKQLYATLEDKEKELRDFIRNYEQRMKESDESLRHLAAERDETEREKWNILKHARDESERVVKLSAQLGLKEATVKKLQEELDMVRKQLTSVGYYSDAESVRTNGLTTPTASTPACSPLPVSTPTPTPNGRGSSADSGVRLSSDRDSTASHDGGPGTPKESPSLSPLYATPVSLRGEDQVGENNTPSGAPTPTAASINSSAISGLANSSASAGGLSRSAEQLCERLNEAADSSKGRGSFTLTRKSHKGGGTWGSISRVFARQKKRAALDASLYDGNGSDKRASWSPSSSLCASPLTEESYSEKLRLLEEAQHIPLERWKAPTVLAWLEVTLGMPQYGAMCAENVRSGKVLLELSDSELEAGLGITHPMHRKKLRLAIEELREPRLTRFPRISTLGHTWVSSEWLPDLGLPQYSETFANNLVDGRLLEALTKKELEKHLGVHRKFHQASVIHGVHLLRIVRFDRQVLAERRRQSDHIDTDPVVWTNMRWIRWARSIDLAEYADNLKDSGVHGALVVLESSFTADTMATALGIPQSKNIIRRHLATELESLVNPARQQLDEQARYAKMERRRQEKLASGGSLGRSFSRSYGTGLEKGEKDKRRSSLRGSLSRALGLRLREETVIGGTNGGESSSSGGQSPAVTTRTHGHHVPQARPRSSIMPSAAYVHHETHRRVKSIGDIETITVTPV